MKPGTYNQISVLSYEFKDPVVVKRLMKNYVDAVIGHLKASNVKDMLELHVKNKIALKDVHDTALTLTAKLKLGQAKLSARLKIEKSTMMSKLLDAMSQQFLLSFLLVLSLFLLFFLVLLLLLLIFSLLSCYLNIIILSSFF